MIIFNVLNKEDLDREIKIQEFDEFIVLSKKFIDVARMHCFFILDQDLVERIEPLQYKGELVYASANWIDGRLVYFV